MIKLIVGLGNPGQQYEKTRHNVGFLFLDRLVSDFGASWSSESKFQGVFSICELLGFKVMLLKPSVFMNRSGLSVGKVARYYKLMPEEILIVHDELDFSPGVVKLKKGGGHAGHNGLRDIISHLESNEFYRLRVGIGRPVAGGLVADYVLSVPSSNDAKLIDFVISDCMGCLNELVSGGIAVAMNKINAA